MQVMNSTIGSSICSNAIPQIAEEFNITNQQMLVLPISIFLIGYILGPLVWGPSSEYFGRKKPLLIAFIGFMIFTLACAVANSYASLLIFRLLNGMMASSPIAITGGLFADVHDDPTLRGRLMAYYMAVCHSPVFDGSNILITRSALHSARSWVPGSPDLLPSLVGDGASGLDSSAPVQLCPWSSSCLKHTVPLS
jgi:MFS family permease